MSRKLSSVGCVYLLTNLRNGKRYVGQDGTNDPESNRYKGHLYLALETDDPRPLYRAIRKAYKESGGCTVGFSAEVVWRGPIEKLHEKEIYYIKKLHSYILDPKGDGSYNLTLGGEGSRGCVWSEESKRRLSEVHLQSYATNPSRSRKLSASLQAYYADEENCEKLSVAQLKSYAEDPARGKALSETLRKVYEDPTMRAQAVAVLIKRYEDPAEREKMSMAQTLRYKEQLEHVKTSAANLKWFDDPANREKNAASKRTPEHCAKQSADKLKRWGAMTSEERKAYWHITHPNGNGWGKHKGKSKAARRKAAEAKTETKASKPKKK
jgi:hypothetical protein